MTFCGQMIPTGPALMDSTKFTAQMSPSMASRRCPSGPLRAIVVALLAGVAGACDVDTISVRLKCTEPAPVLRADGIWRGQVAGRELVVTLKQECSSLGFNTFWSVAGTWEWGGVSAGTAFLLERTINLKGNPNDYTSFRGLGITINETAPYNTMITGSATGELPLTGSPAGPWQSISGDSITLVRQ